MLTSTPGSTDSDPLAALVADGSPLQETVRTRSTTTIAIALAARMCPQLPSLERAAVNPYVGKTDDFAGTILRGHRSKAATDRVHSNHLGCSAMVSPFRVGARAAKGNGL